MLSETCTANWQVQVRYSYGLEKFIFSLTGYTQLLLEITVAESNRVQDFAKSKLAKRQMCGIKKIQRLDRSHEKNYHTIVFNSNNKASKQNQIQA